ncbi:hypothetical protein G6F46_004118 [Rhizopus delemar]|uniref:Uncharacterized protein n=3 Tax=Rhizopus TaxID=4842 RepID=I1CLK0_RHIO9|nr:hypothetical protein RO3G_14041 [Rhizopus delemar RA 99-880]KAG1462572.1 hypothetical protein G6F55_002876 [Rhizopus delemar]KAG1547319.1 hypothetical protein G6F51_004332 [Rhizopus arrhizus]KAG1500793.1 hypothetical protein G6F54_003473 [Rhizopus delemar]KAG1514346.1 hypothetical protein G6F53_003737 [Rhizopus delemar]|eukprot:EIE89330.1 hypothetical protein RO3G_14041 [Rhizopus delemar RA 99-880]
MRSILFITFAISCLIGSNLALPAKSADKPVEKIGHIAEKVDNKVENEVGRIKRDIPLVGSLPDIAGGGLGLSDSEPSGEPAPNQSQTDAYTDAPSDKGSLKKRNLVNSEVKDNDVDTKAPVDVDAKDINVLSRKIKRDSAGPLDGLPVSSLGKGGLPVVGDITKGGIPGTGALGSLPIPGAGSKGGLPDVTGLVGTLPAPLSSLGGSEGETEEPAPEKPAPKKPAPKAPAGQNAAKKAHGTAKNTADATSDTAADVADDTTAAK